MAQRTLLKAKGLYTDSNQLSSIPEGSLSVADNVIIDRTDIIEPRRGNTQYGNTFGLENDRSSQLLTYKNRILIHYNNTLLFNDNPHDNINDGNFLEFDGIFEELEPGRRIRSRESNKNLYFTTKDGVKKISAKTADDLTTAVNYITDAGAAKALDVTGDLISNPDGFLPPNSEVAYRIVWGYKDSNDNLLLGSPSSRVVVSNFTQTNANVNLKFVIPDSVDTSLYFYQVYRTAVFTAIGSLTIDDIDPGDEMQLVIEDFVTTQVPGDVVEVEDIAPEDFRQGGLFLYTNPNSGDGIGQANEPPPKAKDITMYQSTLFYANTESRARADLAILSVSNLVSGASSITIDDTINPSQTYTFFGKEEVTDLDFNSYIGAIPNDLDGKYCLVNSAGDKRKYYVWYDNTKTTQQVDFSNYIGTVPVDLEGQGFVLYTPDDEVTYYVWYDSGTTIDPGTLPGSPLTGFFGIRVDISSFAVALPNTNVNEQLADLTAQAILLNDINGDFDVVHVAPNNIINIESESFDDSRAISLQTLDKGFSYTAVTPTNSDPGNDVLVNTDVAGRTGFRVNVSRGITTTINIADATAAAILEQDNAADFDVVYLGGTIVTLTTTNNGNTTDAEDSQILANQISNGFVINVAQQGDGEDALLNQVLLSAAASPSQRIDETARSLVNVINKNSNGTVYAFYLSGANDLPGLMLLESRDIGINQFSVVANNSPTGEAFNPSLPPAAGAQPFTGETETKPNRVYFAKLQQPEAVPILNFIDVGPEDKEISRILSLRESLFLLKEDGIYRLTGANGAYAVDLFDESTQIIAPDSAVVLNNQIYCLTNQGIVVISDTGVNIISSDIDDIVKLISSSNYDFKFTSFGVSYETDRSYLLWLPSSTSDDVATQALRYSTVTSTFTIFPIAKTCGLVNSINDKLYLGTSDTNFIEQERKTFNRTDYADREYDLIIPADSVDDNILKLSSTQNVKIGDALVQNQYLTISEYNQLLSKLDLDPGTGAPEEAKFDFTSYTGLIPSDLHSKYFIMFSAGDNNKYAIFYDAQGDLTELDTLIFNDINDAIQIRVDVTSAVTTEDLALATKAALSTGTLEFVSNHVSGNSFLNTVTTRNGETTDALDGVINGLNSGFNITTTSQGVGNFLGLLQAVSGDNLRQKINDLAVELDIDPGVNDTDYLVTVTPFGPTFQDSQDAFNALVNKLNSDSGVFYSNYGQSEDSKEFEVLIIDKLSNTTDVVMQFSTRFIEGPIVLYKGINCNVVYASDPFGDASISKHVREGTFIFEDNNFSRASVGYSSDLSPGFENIEFEKDGKGDWSLFAWSKQNWGGGFSGVPLRTYIPRQKQRCRYLKAKFEHNSAREKFALYGISYTFRPVSEKAYRD